MSGTSTVRHPMFSRLYSWVVVPAMAKKGAEDLRRRTLAGLTGTVVEVGAGDGARGPEAAMIIWPRRTRLSRWGSAVRNSSSVSTVTMFEGQETTSLSPTPH